MENLDLVYQETSSTHSRPAARGSRQAIQAKPDHPNGVVSPSRGFPNNMQQVAPAKNRPICHEVQQQVASGCVTGTGSPGHSSGCTRSAMGGSGRIRLRTTSHIGQSGVEVAGLPMRENHSDYSGVAQHGLFWGSNGHVQPNSTEPAHSAQPVDTALPSDPSQKCDNLNLHAWLVEPQQSKSRASLRQGQQKLRILKEDQPDQSMRQDLGHIYKWCLSNQVDFRAPPVKSVADFLMYPFRIRNCSLAPLMVQASHC